MKSTLKLALLASSALFASSALAQTEPIPPEHYVLDERGMDLLSGKWMPMSGGISIGRPGDGLSYHQTLIDNQIWWDHAIGGVKSCGIGIECIISVDGDTEVFNPSSTLEFKPKNNSGSSLVYNYSDSTYIYTRADGTRYVMERKGTNTFVDGVVTRRISPDGVVTNYNYKTITGCHYQQFPNRPPVCIPTQNSRIQSYNTNTGYMVHYEYKSNDPEDYEWRSVEKVTALNLAIDSCAPLAETCVFTRPWPSITLSTVTLPSGTQERTFTDQTGKAIRYQRHHASSTKVFVGDDVDPVITYEWPSPYDHYAITDATGRWEYRLSDAGSIRTMEVTGPLGQKRTMTTDLTVGRPRSYTEAISSSPAASRTWSWTYNAGRVATATSPEGETVNYTYDARGNVTQVLHVPKPGTGLANVTTSAVYPATCANPVTCNQPTSTTDPLGNTTNYTYDATHGGVLTITAPAPATGAARPQTRIAYAPQTAWYKNASGVLEAAPSAVTLPVSISECVTGTSCAGAANEVKTSIVYGASGVANNLLPTSVTTGAGNGSLSATTTMTYTPNGDVATVNGPLAGTADTTIYRYDNARQLIGVVGPDPDGTGPLLRRAQRYTYNPRGQVTLAEVGTVTGTSDALWAAFASLQKSATTYDTYGRPTHQRQQSGSTTHALVQTSYDAAGRVDCVATRMNPATFASPPASACSAGTAGSFGPDRIVKYGYDAASQLISTISGVGIDPITERAAYSLNGKPVTLTDGKGNVTTLIYDGYDRLSRMNYPNATGGGSNINDYELYSYDAAGQLLTYRNRGGNTFTSGYDALGRQTSVTGGSMAARAYAYDNLGRLTSASITAGGSMTRTWDALGRLTSETQNPLAKTVSYQYDLAGRRTRLTWPDGFFVNYDYNTVGDLTTIRENGATDWTLAAWNYDNLGRRTAMTRANGASTTWTYNVAGRLSRIRHDLPGTADDQTLTYTYNPAGQIVTRLMANTAYAYAPAAGTVSYANNGRNQVTSVGGSAVAYDARHNITSAPAMGTYAYDNLNQMTSATVGGTATSFLYDPAGRMSQMGTTRLLHDGARPIAEYTAAGAILRRYVPGLAMDETVTAYEGAGLTDRRWLLADERLSVTAYTNGTGGILSRNTYDEYGQPGSGNSGLFQYTGQIWLPQAQAYHYKARVYAPQLGRFMQTDPIGYGGGANLYTYVGANPMNATDPWGLCEIVSMDGFDKIDRSSQSECKVSAKRSVTIGGPSISFGDSGQVGVGSGGGSVGGSPSGTCPEGYLQADITLSGGGFAGPIGQFFGIGLRVSTPARNLGLPGKGFQASIFANNTRLWGVGLFGGMGGSATAQHSTSALQPGGSTSVSSIAAGAIAAGPSAGGGFTWGPGSAGIAYSVPNIGGGAGAYFGLGEATETRSQAAQRLGFPPMGSADTIIRTWGDGECN